MRLETAEQRITSLQAELDRSTQVRCLIFERVTFIHVCCEQTHQARLAALRAELRDKEVGMCIGALIAQCATGFESLPPEVTSVPSLAGGLFV